jgi:hypothetical protein
MRARGVLTDVTLIDQRPAKAEDRSVSGHWEGDLIVGTGNRVRDRHPGRTHDLVHDPATPGRGRHGPTGSPLLDHRVHSTVGQVIGPGTH